MDYTLSSSKFLSFFTHYSLSLSYRANCFYFLRSKFINNILNIHNTLINSAITTDVPLDKLVMIKMLLQSTRNNKIRVINKIEAECNLALKYFWSYTSTIYCEKIKYCVKINGVYDLYLAHQA